MGFLGGLFGTSGGASGTGYSAPSGVGGDTGVVMANLPPVLNSQAQDAQVNTLQALQQQQALLQALQGQGGLQGQSQIYNQLQNIAAGGGPNPAQAQFQQNANQVAAQTAGLIGSQKGISPALQARLIAQQGAEAGQNAAGDAATLQAQQQMSALGGSANMANTMAGQQIAQQNNLAAARYNQQNMLLGALTGNIGQNVQMQGNVNSANTDLVGNVMGGQQKMFGGLMDAASSGATQMGGPRGPAGGSPPIKAAHGGQVPSYANGGMTGPQSEFGRLCMNAGGMIHGENLAQQMKPVPGQAQVAGDSLKNDTVEARLSPGEIIIPRSIAMHENAPEMAARFVAAVKAKHGRGIG